MPQLVIFDYEEDYPSPQISEGQQEYLRRQIRLALAELEVAPSGMPTAGRCR
jgi:hypothetical protein